jgi:hypothetical protein
MLAAPRAKAIRESEKILFVDLIEDGSHGVLDEFVFQGRDSQRKLHIGTMSFWAGPRSAIPSTHCAVKGFQY